eukprot:1154278-Pleurochrysis_carterae.AAC.1
MHGLPICIRIGHAYSRSARAPLPKLLDSRSRWLLPTSERPFLEPPHRRASARAPAIAPSPPTVVFYIYRRLKPARMVADLW